MNKLKSVISERKKILGYVGKNQMKQSLKFLYDQLKKSDNPEKYCKDLIEHWMTFGYMPFNSMQAIICLNTDYILSNGLGIDGFLESAIEKWADLKKPDYDYKEVGWFGDDKEWMLNYH